MLGVVVVVGVVLALFNSQALGALLRCGSDDLDKALRELVLPQFRNLVSEKEMPRDWVGIVAMKTMSALRRCVVFSCFCLFPLFLFALFFKTHPFSLKLVLMRV